MKRGMVKGRKQCKTPGCRKRAPLGKLYCKECQADLDEAAFPIDKVMKMTDLEAYKFSSLDTEIRNHLQGIRIVDLEKKVADIDHIKSQERRDLQKKQLSELVESKQGEYASFINNLASKYNLDAQKMSLDPDSKIIRDLRKEE